MGQLLQFPSHRIVREVPLTRKQLANHWQVSEKYIQRRQKEGLPYEYDKQGKTRFRLGEVEAWMRSGSENGGAA